MGERGFSEQVSWFNFILCLLVVWVHAVNTADSGPALAALAAEPGAGFDVRIQDLLSNGLAQMAVPGFFMMSACLFYRTLRSFRQIGKKWQSRVYSLLIPYCAWNLIYYLLHVLWGDAPFSSAELNRAVTFYAYNPVFWYVFQLILLTLLAPLIYLLARDIRIAVPALLAVLLAVYRQWDLPWLNEDALFYYLLGAACGMFWQRRQGSAPERACGRAAQTLNRQTNAGADACRQPDSARGKAEEQHVHNGGAGAPELSTVRARFRCCLAAAVFLPLALLFTFFMKNTQASAGGTVLFTVLTRASMAACFWYALGALPLGAPPACAGIGFFIYAAHYPLVRAAALILAPLLALGPAVRMLVYLAMPAFCAAAAWALSRILKRWLPQEWNILSGWRSGHAG